MTSKWRLSREDMSQLWNEKQTGRRIKGWVWNGLNTAKVLNKRAPSEVSRVPVLIPQFRRSWLQSRDPLRYVGGTFPFSFLRWGCLLLSNPDPGFGDQECLNKPKQCIAPFYRVHSRMVRAGFYLGLESFLRLQPGTAVGNKHLWCHPYINIPTSCCVPCLNTWANGTAGGILKT